MMIKELSRIYGLKIICDRNIKEIAKTLDDNSLKTEAIDLLHELQLEKGNDIWNLFGNISAKNKELLKQKFNEDEGKMEMSFTEKSRSKKSKKISRKSRTD